MSTVEMHMPNHRSLLCWVVSLFVVRGVCRPLLSPETTLVRCFKTVELHVEPVELNDVRKTGRDRWKGWRYPDGYARCP